ncbi:hypothetical protein OZX67_07230 [Bifidobacterium sp. ESL0728]|uniref:hypothetical protein n=1 Tax=Bifidobacterium sp. ESL0728 TaxID=2983220 RepID=UPI0023F82EF6|nr:hypothetical protein [Bifidobacterium sp. ESL0728]WEV58590.1 hypothetical protein OZX67_07230 [Bifidobacterium sp. ESL0728]
MSSGFKITAVVLFSLAVVCAILAVILYFAWNIRAIRDTLTGKTAERRIAELRRESGRWKVDSRRSEAQEKETPWRASQIRGGSDSEPLDSSSLSVEDSISAEPSAASEDEENVGTTLLNQSPQAEGGEADEEEGLSTTLLGRDEQADVDDDEEGAASLLEGPKKGKPVSPHKASDGDDGESATTLLGGASARSEGDGDEEPSTTLLGGASARSADTGDEESATTLLGGASARSTDDSDEESATTLLHGSEPKGGGRR